jgi:hypothetical protein
MLNSNTTVLVNILDVGEAAWLVSAKTSKDLTWIYCCTPQKTKHHGIDHFDLYRLHHSRRCINSVRRTAGTKMQYMSLHHGS